MSKHQRLTLVARNERTRADGDVNEEVPSRIAFIDSGVQLRNAAVAALHEPHLDVERLIVDSSAPAETFLELLAALPHQFSGDVLRIDEGGAGFLSATGRGGDRVLYSLGPKDVEFYLIMHGLERFE